MYVIRVKMATFITKSAVWYENGLRSFCLLLLSFFIFVCQSVQVLENEASLFIGDGDGIGGGGLQLLVACKLPRLAAFGLF